MSSSSLPSRTAEDVSIAFDDRVSPVCVTGGGNTSDAPLISDLQLVDRRHLERHCPLRARSSTSKMPKSGASIDDLPDELMLEIFSYVSSNEIIHVLQQVCIRWKTLAHNSHLWRHRKYVVGSETSEREAFETIAAMPQLRTVILEKYVGLWFFVDMSRYCPHLTTLQTNSEQDLWYEFADVLFDGCKNIESLTISDYGLRCNPSFVTALARLEHLRVLHLVEVKDVVLSMDPKELQLRVLSDNCPHLSDLELGTDQGIDYEIEAAEYFISSHKRVLQHLSIKWTSVERRSIAPLLPRVETLQSLQLLNVLNVSPEVVTEAYSALGQLHSLQQLRILYIDEESEHLFTTILANGGFPKLRQLCPGYLWEGKTIRAVVEHCPELEELVLSCTEGDEEELLEPLQQLKKLQILKVYDCKFRGGKAMAYIAKIPALHTLEFCRAEFDKLKPSVDCILEMSGLRRIYLKYSKCWDIPFHKFPDRLLNLRELEICECEGDQEVLDRVCAQMPHLRTKGRFGITETNEEDCEFWGLDDKYFEEDV